jgi:hypothetical protein
LIHKGLIIRRPGIQCSIEDTGRESLTGVSGLAGKTVHRRKILRQSHGREWLTCRPGRIPWADSTRPATRYPTRLGTRFAARLPQALNAREAAVTLLPLATFVTELGILSPNTGTESNA